MPPEKQELGPEPYGDGIQTPRAEDDPVQDYSSIETARGNKPPLLSADHAHSVLRKWYAIRWNLARTIFARPVPFLTESFQLKLGDCIITLPLAIIFIAINAALASSGDASSSGAPAAIVMIIVFALAVRNNAILLTATGLPFERAILYHKFFGGVAWITSGLHGLAYLRNTDKYKKDGTLPVQWTGAITFFALSALVVFAFEPIRRRFFDLFLRMHWILFIVIVIFGIIHGAGIILIGFVPWVLDLLYRLVYRAPKFAKEGGGVHANDVTIKLITKDLVRIQFPRAANGTGFQYEAGQYAFLCIPSISHLEWHPFSIASAPHEPNVTFYVKVLGGWTKKLASWAGKHTGEPTPILVDGPYGSVAVEMEYYSHFAFFSGGIGVTPMRSLMNDLYFTSAVAKSRRSPVEKARFVWAGREREMLQALILDEARAIHAETNMESWFPHVLASPSHANSHVYDTFIADFHLTNKPQDLSEAVDQQLALCLKHNQRPDVEKILRELGADAQESIAANNKAGPIRVAVLVCGPAAMVAEVTATSRKLTKSMNIVFDVHEETFAL